MSVQVQLNPSWMAEIGDEFDKSYMQELKIFLLAEKQAGCTVYPKGGEIFNAMNATAFGDVKVVILGQDPYHGEGQAHGLSFSVRDGVALPLVFKIFIKKLLRNMAALSAQRRPHTLGAARRPPSQRYTHRAAGEAGSHQNKVGGVYRPDYSRGQ